MVGQQQLIKTPPDPSASSILRTWIWYAESLLVASHTSVVNGIVGHKRWNQEREANKQMKVEGTGPICSC